MERYQKMDRGSTTKRRRIGSTGRHAGPVSAERLSQRFRPQGRAQGGIALALAGVAALAPVGAVYGATFSSSTTAPTVNASDVANFGAQTGTDKWFFQTANESGVADAAKGQTFTSGTTPVLLKALTYKISSGNKKAAPTTYTIRVGSISGTNFTQIASEKATQTVDTATGAYMTWRFSTPVLLAPNTVYGVDVTMKSDVAWGTGIPYLSYSASSTNSRIGVYYDSGDAGVGGATIMTTTARDRVFHLDLEDPMRPTPADGATVLAGTIPLSWVNVATNVYVDVWFGTNSGALARVVTGELNRTNTTVSAPLGATYYWRVNSYTNGAPTGTPITGTLFRFIVVDADNDGLPDAFEWAYTTPPSYTAMNPGDDLDTDGLTNLQEYQRGTIPTNADTDGDTLKDGDEVTGAGARPATNPLLADTDGDGLSDGVESNTGTWVGTTNRGTNPTKTDTDGDGLDDGVESNTGMYISVNNTGTNPLLKDTDSDGAGDWYEVAGSFTNPTNPNNKPTVPYPLPDPDAKPPATNKPVKVFILSGQSNMVGIGDLAGTAPGTLETITKREGKFPNLLNATNGWTFRNDVIYKGVITATAAGPLSPGQGSDSASLGPELGFGSVVGYHFDEPVLLIKASQGNRGLFWDILPPGSPRWTNGATVYAGYGEGPNSWATGGGPSPYVWYAGKQYDDFFLAEADMGAPAWVNGTVYTAAGQYARHNGKIYTSKSAHTASSASEPGVGTQSATYWSVYSVYNVADVLDNFGAIYTNYAAQGFEIAGYVWFQGNWDLQSTHTANRYETNLVNFITALRKYYANRYPGKCSTNTPFVLATGCGDPGTNGNGLIVANAQLAMNSTSKYPRFAGNVKTMDTRGYWRDVAESPMDQGYHYHHNAETYMLTGDALGRGMLDLLPVAPAILSLSPADNATGVAVGTNLVVTFNQTIVRGTGYITLKNLTDATQSTIAITDVTQVAVAGPVLTINPVTNLMEGRAYAIQIAATAIDDTRGNSFVGITNDTTWNITTLSDHAAWAATYPGANLSDPNADFDGDGLNNANERTWGLNPTNAASRNPFPSTSGLSSGNFSYTRRAPALTGFNYTVWTSSNLASWTQDTGAVQTPGAAVAEVETVSVRLSPARLGGPLFFVRVRAETP